MRALTAEEFSAKDAVGGVRGVVESVAPGLLFVVVYLATGQSLKPALIAASAAAVIAVVVRLVQRTPVTQAFSGLLGVGIGVFWAWKTGDANNYFAYGLWVNVAYFLATLLSIVVGWPLVGLIMGLFRPEGPLSSDGQLGRGRRVARGPGAAASVRARDVAVGRPVRPASRRPGAAVLRVRDRLAGHGEAGDGSARDRARPLDQLDPGPWVSRRSSSDSSASRPVTNSSSSRPSRVSSGLGAIGRVSRTIAASTVSDGHSI